MEDLLKKKIKSIYKFDNEKLKNFSTLDFLISIGYPEIFLKSLNRSIIKNSFPIMFPFKNINLKDKKILDIGCGIGLDCYYSIKQKAKIAIGMDISKTLVNKGLNFFYKIIADVEDIPLKSNDFFDIIIFNGSFNQIKEKSFLLNFIHKIVVKNGIVLICDLMWIGSNKEFEYYKKDENAWVFNIGGSLTEQDIWNIEAKTQFKIFKFEKYEKIFPVQKYRLILKKL